MTSDAVQNKHAGPIRRKSDFSKRGLELTREQSFLDGAQDVFDLLSQQKQQHKEPANTLDATARYVANAREKLAQAEVQINEQFKHLKKLEDISGIDPLTGLLNDRGFAKTLSKEVARTNRGYNEGGLVVMFNLENYPHIEKEFGNTVTDKALRLLARALLNEIRDMDSAARINDSEFVLLLCETNMESALSRLQNMAMRLNRLSLVWNGQEISLNLSLGLKSFMSGDQADRIFIAASADLSRNRKGVMN